MGGKETKSEPRELRARAFLSHSRSHYSAHTFRTALVRAGSHARSHDPCATRWQTAGRRAMGRKQGGRESRKKKRTTQPNVAGRLTSFSWVREEQGGCQHHHHHHLSSPSHNFSHLSRTHLFNSVMRLRIRHREGIATLTTLTDQSSLLDLHVRFLFPSHPHPEPYFPRSRGLGSTGYSILVLSPFFLNRMLSRTRSKRL